MAELNFEPGKQLGLGHKYALFVNQKPVAFVTDFKIDNNESEQKVVFHGLSVGDIPTSFSIPTGKESEITGTAAASMKKGMLSYSWLENHAGKEVDWVVAEARTTNVSGAIKTEILDTFRKGKAIVAPPSLDFKSDDLIRFSFKLKVQGDQMDGAGNVIGSTQAIEALGTLYEQG